MDNIDLDKFIKNDTLDLTQMDLSMFKMDAESEQFKYLKIRSDVWIKKLENKYPNIIAKYLPDDPGNITVKMNNWKLNNKIILLIGEPNEKSILMINTTGYNLPNNMIIEGINFKEEFEYFCQILDKMILLIK